MATKKTNKIGIVGAGFSGAVMARELAEATAATDAFLQRKGRNEPIPSFFVKPV